MKSNYEQEIFTQPGVLRKFILAKGESIARIAESCRAYQPSFILIAARGTSDNAATYAKYLSGAFLGIPVALAMPSLVTLYHQPPKLHGGLVVGISQSGESPDVMAVLAEARQQKVPTLVITNRADSPMAKAADAVIELEAGEEKSVAASKTYTAQLAAIAALVAYWSEDAGLVTGLSALGDLAEEVLDQNSIIEKVASRFAEKDHLVVIGRGINHCTAYEIALKIKELTYIASDAYSAADFRHGPIAILHPGFPVVAIAPLGKALDNMKEMVAEIQGYQPDLALLSNDEAWLHMQELPIRLPASLPEWLSPIIAVIPGQLLALRLALKKGLDPDRPRSLHKVTRTL